MKYLKNQLELYNHGKFLSWKRKNITIRGVSESGVKNSGGARFGSGLYTAFLSNKNMAKAYGTVVYVLNAIPSKPKIFNDTNRAEIFIQTELIDNWCKKNNSDYNPNFFGSKTSIVDQMLILGYNGIIIKGKEMVNYTPIDIMYFKDDLSLLDYYNEHIKYLFI